MKSRIVYALAIGCLLQNAQQTPVVQSVDLAVPFAPVTFKQSGRIQLAYELHVTNFQSVAASLTAVRVKAGGAGPVLAEYRDQDLHRAIVRPGLGRDHATPHVVGPGMRAIVNFWIALPDGAPAPASVTHDIELDVLRQEPVRTVVEGGTAAVAKDPAVVLDPPLRGGPWVALYDPLLKGGHRTAVYTTGGKARIPGRFAIDWIALPAGGVMAPKPATGPDDRNGFGSDVLAVADGVIAAAVDGVADPTPPPVPLEIASGNYVAIDLGGGRFAFYEHLQRGSVVVKAGDRVTRGQVVARLGASGSTSVGPHLHFHVADANSPLAEGLPFVFRRFEHLGGFSSIDGVIGGEKWSPVSGGAPDRTVERPAANSVVRFP